MPLIRIETNEEVSDQGREDVLNLMTELVVRQLNKPREYVQILLVEKCAMAFGGTTEPAAFVEIRSLGLPDRKPKAISGEVCQILRENLGIEPARVFINFFDMPKAHWGWNGETFG